MNNWQRPSMQQPRWIANVVKSLVKPLTIPLNYVKDFWDTWHRVYQPDGRPEVYKPGEKGDNK